jgi:hypothetical protein
MKQLADSSFEGEITDEVLRERRDRSRSTQGKASNVSSRIEHTDGSIRPEMPLQCQEHRATHGVYRIVQEDQMLATEWAILA